MKEVKYQAWHKLSSEMRQVISIELDPEMGGVEVWGNDCVDFLTGEHEPDRDFLPWDQIELREYTGLKDKNGKEGYADDLVEMFERSLWHITWDEYYARYQLNLVKGDEIRKVFDMGQLRYAKIVGNVYEHPELLAGDGKKFTASVPHPAIPVISDPTLPAGTIRIGSETLMNIGGQEG
jgi:YopX protein